MHTLKYNNIFVSVIELRLIPHISVQTNKILLKGNEWILPGAGPIFSLFCLICSHTQFCKAWANTTRTMWQYFIFHICVANVKVTVQAVRTFSIRTPADLPDRVHTPASTEDKGISSVPETKRNLIFSPFLHSRHYRIISLLMEILSPLAPRHHLRYGLAPNYPSWQIGCETIVGLSAVPALPLPREPWAALMATETHFPLSPCAFQGFNPQTVPAQSRHTQGALSATCSVSSVRLRSTCQLFYPSHKPSARSSS